MGMNPDEIQEIKLAIKAYEEADDMEARQHTRFVIEIHAVDWIAMLLDELGRLESEIEKVPEVSE